MLEIIWYVLQLPGEEINATKWIYFIQIHVDFAQLLSHVWLSVTFWTVTSQGPLSMGFPRQDYCNGLLFPSPGDLPIPGIEPAPPTLAGGFFTTNTTSRLRSIGSQRVEQDWSDWACISATTFIYKSCIPYTPSIKNFTCNDF